MTVDAPAANAFTMSPENLIPPSAMTGTPALRLPQHISKTALS